jgi:hypothetical protein
MAAATVTKTEWGFYVTGGTDATTVTTQQTFVKAFIFIPDDDDDTVAITNGAGTAVFTTVGANADETKTIEFFGNRIDGIKATLNDDGNVLLVLTA